jgi:hypothetical protein
MMSRPIQLMQLDAAKAKQPSLAPWIPEEYAAVIGKLALTMGWLEHDLVALLATIETCNGAPSAPIPMGLGRRIKRLKMSLLGVSLAKAPSLVCYVRSLVERIEDQEWKRNFLIHGKMKAVLKARVVEGKRPEIDSLLEVTARHHKRLVTETFTSDQIDDVYHEAAHLWGLLRASIEQPECPVVIELSDWNVWRQMMAIAPPQLAT